MTFKKAMRPCRFCLKSPNGFHAALRITLKLLNPKAQYGDMFPWDTSPSTLPLYTNLNHTEFPKVHHLLYLHLQLFSYLPGTLEPVPTGILCSSLPYNIRRQALRNGHWCMLSNSELKY